MREKWFTSIPMNVSYWDDINPSVNFVSLQYRMTVDRWV